MQNRYFPDAIEMTFVQLSASRIGGVFKSQSNIWDGAFFLKNN